MGDSSLPGGEESHLDEGEAYTWLHTQIAAVKTAAGETAPPCWSYRETKGSSQAEGARAKTASRLTGWLV